MDFARSTGRTVRGLDAAGWCGSSFVNASIRSRPTRERIADAEDHLDRFGGLNRSNEPRKHTEHARFRAARDEPWWRRLWEEASVARAIRRLPKTNAWPSNRSTLPYTFGLPEQHTRVVRQVARPEVVGAINDYVVLSDDVERVRGTQLFIDRFDPHQRVDGAKSRARGIGFSLADTVGVVQKLALQVRQLDRIEVGDPDPSHAGRSQVERCRRSESARADNQNARTLQPALTVFTNFGRVRCAGCI